jgi:replicative DNA helicase
MALAPANEELSHRVPPQNIEAEQAVIGAILIENEALYRVIEIIKPEDFYRPSHIKIYGGILALAERNEPVDLVTLTDFLKTHSQLEAAGGSSYLASLVDGVPTAANVAHYATIVRDKSMFRRLISVATHIVTRGYESSGDVDSFLDHAEKQIFEIAENKIRQPFAKLSDLIGTSFKAIEELYEKKELVTGLPMGFTDVDRLTSGLHPSDLIIVAGRPSMGKTSFALNIALNAARSRNVPVAMFSLEMSQDQLVQRLLCTEAKVDAAKMRSGFFSKDDWERLTLAAGKLSDVQFYIDDTPALDVLTMRAKARRLQREQGLGLVVVDYLQLMRGHHGRTESREREISDISLSLKALAKELNIPVVALSQLNRLVESRRPPIPQMADLRESGALEQDADLIMFIYREEVYDKETLNKGIAEIHIGKQRNGPTGIVRLAFNGAHTRFDDLSYETPSGDEI